jgi:hypothetical protein
LTSMEFVPRRSSLRRGLHRMLYRNRMFAVILAVSVWCTGSLSLLAAQDLTTRYGHKAAADKGPRALGLVQLSAKSKKARFIPITIMMDGKFYDAGSYKASPVPMALDFGIVYEGFRAGVSQGLFTITQPGQLNHVWIAEGTWLPAGEIDPHKHKKYSTPVIADDDKDGPPVLHRRSEKSESDGNSDKDKKEQPKPATASAPTASTVPPPAVPTTSAPPTAAPTTATPTPPQTTKSATAPETVKASAPDEPIGDPNRPRLRRGKPDASEHHEPFTMFDALTDASPAATSGTAAVAGKLGATAKDAAAPPQIVVMPAISDVGGPDPRPYTYEVKPEEEAGYRSKMLDLAAAQLRGQTDGARPEASATSKKSSLGRSVSGKSAGKTPSPAFDDVSLRIFDLSNSNEPVLVLSAKTHPAAAGATESVEEPKEVTLIARTNLEGELQKLFFSQTDSRHLDVAPRMELIDAVDADGDGRGELLFRRTFDDGSAYAIYRVTADRLWPLFEGTP